MCYIWQGTTKWHALPLGYNATLVASSPSRGRELTSCNLVAQQLNSIYSEDYWKDNIQERKINEM